MKYYVMAVSEEEAAMADADPFYVPKEHRIDTIRADFWRQAVDYCAKQKRGGRYPRSAMIVEA